MTSFADLRASIPAMADTIYLNSGWSGPSSRAVLEAMQDVLETEASVGPASVEGVRLAREKTTLALPVIADLIGGDSDEVAVTHGTTEGVNLVLFGINWQRGDELVTCDLEHGAIMNPTYVLEERFGVVVKRVKVPPAATTQEMLDLYQEAITAKTKLVALSHIQFSVGLRLPVEDICEMAHRAGALVVLDGAQTGGHIDINVRKLGADFYAISGQKWLCGPQATGAFWADPDKIRMINPPWQTHKIADERAESGETAGAPHMLQRFRLASQSPALVAGFTKAIELMMDLQGPGGARDKGTDAIEKHANDLADRLRNGLNELGACKIIGPNGGPESCGLVAVSLEGWQPSQVVNELWDRWRIAGRAVRYPAAVRFSMAAYNQESDADAVVDALRVLSKEEPPIPL
ncbi:MAG: aminotransferase class V-fold PLP-dependent enzyme, partial [Dehalococcoidia bacterium]